MNVEAIKALFLKHKESRLHHRYITNNHIELLLENLMPYLKIDTIGRSALGLPIYGIQVGTGEKRVLMWSQMHGNESTTTKAIFDLLNTLISKNASVKHLLEACTLYIIPILNPDGALAYTRVNGNLVDLNRDAQNLTQPESLILKAIFETFKPHFCYNLHGQRTIFSAGATEKSATVSFLAPAQDEACTITANRTIAMEIIAVMNAALQELIPGQVGVYDDAFNLNCVGDTFQSNHVPTILFEAGHFKNDYARDCTREFIYISYVISLDYISKNTITGAHYKPYLDIPENEKLFFDVIIRNAKITVNNSYKIIDIAIQYHETLIENTIHFIPSVEKMEPLTGYFGHKVIDANHLEVFSESMELLKIGSEIDCVMINSEKISILPK